MADQHHHHAVVSINSRSRGSSKAQLSLEKILQTIFSNQIQAPSVHHHHQSSASASSSSSSSSLTSSSSSVLINIPSEIMGPTVNVEKSNVGSSWRLDLNLFPPPEEEQIDYSDQTHHQESNSPAVNVGDGGGLRENDNGRILEVGPEEAEKKDEREDETDYSHQASHHDPQSPVVNSVDRGKIKENENETILEVGPEEEEKNKRQRKFAALLEVVRLVSGEDGRSEPMDPAELLLRVNNTSTATLATTDYELTRNRRLHPEREEEEKENNNNNAEDEAEEEPRAAQKVSAATAAETAVVRTKGGRAQVLPNKYRDSVVEPITNLSPRRNRSSSSSSKHVPHKRRRSTR